MWILRRIPEDGGYLVEGNPHGKVGLPAEFTGIFGGFIGDKTVEDFKGNPRIFSRQIIWKSTEKSEGSLRDTAISLIFL